MNMYTVPLGRYLGECEYILTCPFFAHICMSRFQQRPGTEILKYSFCIISSGKQEVQEILVTPHPQILGKNVLFS